MDGLKRICEKAESKILRKKKTAEKDANKKPSNKRCHLS
jgi:hypothetical protein